MIDLCFLIYMGDIEMEPYVILSALIFIAGIVTIIFIVWLENTKRFKRNDIWCDVCKKDVKYWSSHVYSKEHVDNLSKRSDKICLVK